MSVKLNFWVFEPFCILYTELRQMSISNFVVITHKRAGFAKYDVAVPADLLGQEAETDRFAAHIAV